MEGIAIGHTVQRSVPVNGSMNGASHAELPPMSSKNHLLPSSCEPPYTAPTDVIYPELTIANPHTHNMSRQPVFDNLPAGSLFRPARLPADMESRVEKASVWMGMDKTSSKAVYFLPPACKQCANPAVAAYCDRGFPDCQRCATRGLTCEPGAKWSQMRPKERRKPTPKDKDKEVSESPLFSTESTEQRYTAAEKGKGRAEPVAEKRKYRLMQINPKRDHNTSIDSPVAPPVAEDVDGGRGKRTKKKRRLSAGEEIDPDTIDDDGHILLPRKKSHARPSLPVPPPAPVVEAKSTSEDQAYFDRIEKNNRKPNLKNMRAACPAWATTRRALQSGAEYFRNPKKIEGGSVEVGVGGVARGVIFEGRSVGGGNYWGVKGAAGTMVTSLGKARPRHTMSDPPQSRLTPPQTDPDPMDLPGPSSPRINILPSVAHVKDVDHTSQPVNEFSQPQPIPPGHYIPEEAEIEALLMAQRARTPIALAVAQDCLEPPFKVPRAFVVLGWFWLTDAWLEPEDLWEGGREPGTYISRPSFNAHNIRLVRWKFRFEWCRGHQGLPWWSSADEPPRIGTPFIEYKFIIEPLAISGPGIYGASTIIHASRKSNVDMRGPCAACGWISETVYKDAKVCLNERCSRYFMPPGEGRGLDPISNTPCSLRPLQRKVPEFLGLKLRASDPQITGGELNRAQLGKDYWRGWVCGKCGMANERRRWAGWDCEGCKHQIYPPRKPLTTDQLRNPLRPECTGPRPDNGFPSFPYKVTSGWSIYEHSIKIVKHQIEYDGSAAIAEIHHALHTRPLGVKDVATELLRDMQEIKAGQGVDGMGLRRYLLTTVSKRPAERYYSPFYTLSCGPDAPNKMVTLPTSEPIPWIQAPTTCLDTIDLINFRAGSMFPGVPEFNSLLVAVTPPPHVPSYQPKIKLAAGEYLAILILGSEGTIKIRALSPADPTLNGLGKKNGKAGEIIMQHGDVMGFKADKGALEITIKMEGFGFVCFSQQVYRSTPEPGAGAFVTTSDRPVITDTGIDASNPSSSATTASNAPPVKPTVSLPPPLIDWYIGPQPLDINQPIRAGKPLRARSDKDKVVEITNGEGHEVGAQPSSSARTAVVLDASQSKGDILDTHDLDAGHGTGLEFYDTIDSPQVFEPDIPPSPNAGRKKTLPSTAAPTPETTKTSKSGGKRKSLSAKEKGDKEADETGSNPSPKKAKAKAKAKDKRISEIMTPSSPGGSTASGATGLARKAGRKSGDGRKKIAIEDVSPEGSVDGGAKKKKKRAEKRKSEAGDKGSIIGNEGVPDEVNREDGDGEGDQKPHQAEDRVMVGDGQV